MLRSGDPKHEKAAEAYLDTATRAVQSHDTAVYQQLSMLRQMASAKFLKLFDEEEETDKDNKEDPARESASGPDTDSVAQSAPALPASETIDSPPQALAPAGTRQENHAHIDLRLQPDHAPEDPGPGRGAA